MEEPWEDQKFNQYIEVKGLRADLEDKEADVEKARLEFEHKTELARVAGERLLSGELALIEAENGLRNSKHDNAIANTNLTKQFDVRTVNDFQDKDCQEIREEYLRVLILGDHKDGEVMKEMINTKEEDRIETHQRLKDYKVVLANVLGLNAPVLNDKGYPPHALIYTTYDRHSNDIEHECI